MLPGCYSLEIVVPGYQSKKIPVKVRASDSGIILDTIRLTLNIRELKTVSVISSKPLIRQQIDRLAYDVQADPESKILNLLDMLRKVPLVSVGIDDGIQIKGNANFKILINGRPAPFPSQNISTILKSMPAASIQRIEIITTPPAKYDGEGLGGLINIVTVKRLADGYNGSLNANYSKLNSGIANSLNIKNGKFGLTSLIGFNEETKPSASFVNSRAGLGVDASTLQQTGDQRYKGRTFYVNEFLSFEPDTLNLFTGSINYNQIKGTNRVDQFTTFSDMAKTQSYQLARTDGSKSLSLEIDINYQHSFKNDPDQTLTASYNFSDERDRQQNQNSFSHPINFDGLDFVQNNHDGLAEHTAQFDYSNTYHKLTLEAGGKYINRNNFSAFTYPSVDDNFSYLQQIYSIYNSYSLDLGSWGFKAGARLEHTYIDLDNTSAKQRYTNVIPSISIQRVFNPYNTLTFGYTQRIQRPSIDQLNPFVEIIDPKIRYTGNPYLLPVLNHSFELGYTNVKKGSFNVNLSYVFSNNTVQPFWTLADSVSTSTYQNIGKIHNLGMSVSIRYPIIKNMNLNINGRIAYTRLQGIVGTELYKNDGYQGFIYSYLSYAFLKTWRTSINGGFYGPTLLLQGRLNSYFYHSFSLSKRLLKNKLVAALAISNPFNKYRLAKSEIHATDFNQNFNSYTYFRNINLSLNYSFGRLKKEIKRADRGIDNDDKITIPK
ncbi:outer membrane beta-barrel family protein [Mucilaginibacter gilvus]|nr:outer membrane beta-barrel family protein [Mucilaginibacter gilvus]